MSNQSVRYSVTHDGYYFGLPYDKLGCAVQAGVNYLHSLPSGDSVEIWEHRRPHGQLKEVVTQFCVISL